MSRRVPLSIETITAVSVERSKRWHHADTVPWTGADWGNAMGGECGEAQNVVKKLRRLETLTMGGHNSGDTDREVLVDKLGEEIADTVLYAVLLAAYYGIDLTERIVWKFNLVSEGCGFPERLTELEPVPWRYKQRPLDQPGVPQPIRASSAGSA